MIRSADDYARIRQRLKELREARRPQVPDVPPCRVCQDAGSIMGFPCGACHKEGL